MATTYPIRTGGAPTGDPHSYGDVDAIRTLLDATDAGAVKSAGDAYRAASQNIEGLKSLLVRASTILSEVWEDEAATAAQQTLRKLQTSAENLVTATRQFGAALDWHGGEILPWYVAHKPGAGWIKDDGDDEYAREYMQRLNHRIAEAWTRLPTSVTAEPVNMNHGTPNKFVANESAGAGNAVASPGGASTGGGYGAMRQDGTFDGEQRSPLTSSSAAQAGSPAHPRTEGVHPAVLSGDAPGGAPGGGRTDLAGAETGQPANPHNAFGNSSGRPAPFGPTGPPAGAPGPAPGLGAPSGGFGASSTRPGPLAGPAGSVGGRTAVPPGRGGVHGGAPMNSTNTNGGPPGSGRTGARGVPISPMGGPGTGGAGPQDEERRRQYWLAEDPEFWDADDTVASVIGTAAPVAEDNGDNSAFANESAEVWGADSAPDHVIGHTSPRSPGVAPQDDRATPCACGCACKGSEDDEQSRKDKAESRRHQGPPARLEASPTLRGE